MVPHRMGRTLTLNHHPRAAATRRGQTHISAANPIFVPEGHDITAAELTAAQKNAISHRGHAFTAIAADIAAW